MTDLMEIDGFNATVEYDPEIEMFRGEFAGLNGGADFAVGFPGDLSETWNRAPEVVFGKIQYARAYRNARREIAA